MASFKCLLLFSFACVLSVNAFTYEDLAEELGANNCPSKNSCSELRSQSFSERVCECDNKCSFFRDCCLDSSTTPSRRTTTQICMHYGSSEHQGVYVIATCPTHYTGELSPQCRQGNVSDPILNAPVTDTTTNRTYLNRYCAQCHDASPTTLRTWIISSCKVEGSRNITWVDLTYRTRLNQWGYVHQGQFHPCEFVFEKPADLSRGMRFCRANVVSSCARRSPDQRLCESYLSLVWDIQMTLYRNPHCAKCNGVSTADLSCPSSTVLGRVGKPFSFALLLDVNRSDGDLVGVVSRCAQGETYDPYFKKCRKLVCAIPGYRMSNNRCVRR